MKLATFEYGCKEQWGFVINHPQYNELWVFSPLLLNIQLNKCRTPTSGLWVSPLDFLIDWPCDLSGFLAMEERGMAALGKMASYVQIALEQGMDQLTISEAGFPLSAVKLKAPIPRPRIYFGLVQNGPSFIRNNPNRNSSNLFPQGHNRPQGTAVGFGDPIVMGGDAFDSWGYNVELGVVIGKKGRYIAANKAMEYVAGYLPVIDIATNGFYKLALGNTSSYKVPEGTDWFQEAMMSWCGKMADTLCPMGPFIVTKDQVPNIYDLLSYTRENGLTRDRAITGSYLLGVERVIQWYSSFGTLYPGDVLHLGTMAVDGLGRLATDRYDHDDRIEAEIERLGSLKNSVVIPAKNEWRDANDPSLKIHPSPAVRDIIAGGGDCLNKPSDWKLKDARHYWTVYSNYRDVKAVEGLNVSDYPRLLNTPASSLAANGATIDIPARATTLDIGIELACVIKKLTWNVKKENAADYILGYTPLLSISDRSFADIIVQPATPQEQALPVVYGRWADGFNVMLSEPKQIDAGELYNLDMRVEAAGKTVTGTTAEYHLDFAAVIEFVSTYITLFPGDVLTLGRTAGRINLDAAEAANNGLVFCGKVDKLGEVRVNILKDEQRKSVKIIRSSDVHVEIK